MSNEHKTTKQAKGASVEKIPTPKESFFEKNQKLIICIVSVIVLAVACIFILKQCNEKKENDVTESTDKILNKQTQQQEPALENFGQKEYIDAQMKELQDKLKDNPSDSASIRALEGFKTQLNDLKKKLNDAKSYYETALNGDEDTMGLLQIIEDNEGTDAANIARIYAAQYYEKLSNLDEEKKKEYIGLAVEMLEAINPVENSTIYSSATYMLGNLYVNQGKKEDGINKMIEAANNCKDESLSPLFLEQAGKVYESMGKEDEAKKIYNQIKEEYPQSVLCRKTSGTSPLDIDIERVK